MANHAVSAPRVTVAIATFNRAHLLGRAIRSALAQTFEDFELLVVDDGSTDATAEVLAGTRDARVRPVRHERNEGVSRTRNTALGLARGDWLAFLDDDNEWAPTYLERQLAFASARPDAGVAYCRALVKHAQSGTEAEVGELRQGRVFCDLVAGWNPFVSSALIRRSLMAAAGGLDDRLRATEDRDLWMCLALRTRFAGSSDVLLIRHERHGPQLTCEPRLLTGDAAILAEKWRDAITAACGRRAYRRWHFRLALWAERCRVDRAVTQGASERASAALWPGAWCRTSRTRRRRWRGAGSRDPRPSAARWVSRRFEWYRYRARKALGI